MRRGFTLIELTMALVMGMVVLVAAMGMFHTMERADAIAEVRAEEHAQLQRTQRVVARAMGSLLIMSRRDHQTAQAALDALADQLTDRDTTPAGEGQGQSASRDLTIKPSVYRPRVRLEPDSRLAETPMIRRVRIGEQGLGPPVSTRPQRLELALSAPPVLPTYLDVQRRWRIAQLGLAPIGEGSQADAQGAVRGAFVFRDERRTNNLGLRVFSLWWQPVSADAQVADAIESVGVDPALVEGAVMLMDSVVWARWRFFKQGEWREDFEVLGELDLAAYAELELTTSQNHTVAWLFELAWTVGTDPDADVPADGADGTQADGAETETPMPGAGGTTRVRGASRTGGGAN